AVRTMTAIEVGLRNFLIDEESIGIACTKFRSSIANGWIFPPLAECREAWCRRYGPVKWDNGEAEEWTRRWRCRIGGQVWYEEEWEPLSKEVALCPGWSTCFRLPLR